MKRARRSFDASAATQPTKARTAPITQSPDPAFAAPIPGTNDFLKSAVVATTGNTVILPAAAWPSLTLANTSAAGFGLGPLAPGSIATAFGRNLAAGTSDSPATPRTSLGGTRVSMTDSAGTVRQALLSYVSPGQVNYLIPTGTAPGSATVSITSNGSVTATGQIDVVPVAPRLFTVNPASLVAANVILVSQNGDQTYESIYQSDQNGNITGIPIDFGSATDAVYLVLYGTGIRNRTSKTAVSAIIDWTVSVPVTYAGPQGLNNPDGLDQINLQLPRSLGSPVLPANPAFHQLQLTVDGQPSNPVMLLIQINGYWGSTERKTGLSA